MILNYILNNNNNNNNNNIVWVAHVRVTTCSNFFLSVIGGHKLVTCPPITFQKLVVPFFEMPPNFFHLIVDMYPPDVVRIEKKIGVGLYAWKALHRKLY